MPCHHWSIEIDCMVKTLPFRNTSQISYYIYQYNCRDPRKHTANIIDICSLISQADIYNLRVSQSLFHTELSGGQPQMY